MTKSHTPGPTGRRVADQIAQLRRVAGISRAELAARLDEVGRPLSGVVIQRIERGDRPVDVDDLIAFALALEVDPLRLMFGGENDEIDVTPQWRTSAHGARLWAQGSTYGGLGEPDQARRLRALIGQLQDEIGEAGDGGEH